MKPDVKAKGGRPHTHPWLTTAVGRSFLIPASSLASVRSSVSRAARLHGVRYSVHPSEKRGHWRLKRES